jgi:hypothetical protein
MPTVNKYFELLETKNLIHMTETEILNICANRGTKYPEVPSLQYPN